jgi:hypothetical protein
MSEYEGSMDKCSRQARQLTWPRFRARSLLPRGAEVSSIPLVHSIQTAKHQLHSTRKNHCHLSMQTRPQSSSDCFGASLAAPCIMLDCGLRSNLPSIHSEGGAQSISAFLPTPS